MRTLIKSALASKQTLDIITVKGWVRTRRDSKIFSFIELNDGSSLQNLQCIIDAGISGYDQIEHMNTGAAVGITGKLIASQGAGQSWEVHATSVKLYGDAPSDFPLQKKGHSQEFLRSIAHLRPRTNLYGAVFRMRSKLAFAIHQFFKDRDFSYIHTPIITASDCEGAGEMFRVTTQRQGTEDSPKNDFFGKNTFLTVSGQLEGEAFACALSNIYTFGPTFRAENSHTTRHASEFWMVEPEMAFCDLVEDMDLAEEFIKFLVHYILEHHEGDLEIFNNFVDKGLKKRLQFVSDRPFQRVSYTEAIKILLDSGQSFEYPVSWGSNLQSEHERYLTEEHFKCPTTVYDYPKDVKPFYMRTNDDGNTVAAMDVLVPGIGEIIGGAQREERHDILEANMKAHGLSQKEYSWYLDLRKFGTCPHAGFGLGFERMLMFVTGMKNIRDVISFARTPGQCDF